MNDQGRRRAEELKNHQFAGSIGGDASNYTSGHGTSNPYPSGSYQRDKGSKFDQIMKLRGK